jgi:putative nucleotidyltransferase with HDIG domain
MVRCPGQDQRLWKPEDIFEVNCSQCGTAVEFFKDEPKLNCHECGHVVVNPKIDLGCAEWCQYAKQCIGVSGTKNTNALRNDLIAEMRGVFASDQKRITHALTVLGYAERIQAAEGGDPLVIKAAAILHDIGVHQAERKHGSSAGKYQELEGPPIAAEILNRRDVPAEAVEHICRIIANHHSARDIDTIEFRCVWDADWLVNIPENFRDGDQQRIRGTIDRVFKTATGHKIAVEELVEAAVEELDTEPAEHTRSDP